jgi:hypothetical protein
MIPAIAQVVFATKISSKKIGKNEILEVSYEVQEGSIENFSEPRFPGWRLVGGPNVSSSTIITNGKRTSSMSYQFLLRPNETGTLTVPGANAMIDGKPFSSKPLTVEVSNRDHVNPSSNSPDPLLVPPMFPPQQDLFEDNDAFFAKEGEDLHSKTKNNLFVLVEVSKKTCYPGEAIKATYKLYSRVNMDAHITKRPSFSGFSSIDLPDHSNSEYEMETRNGKTFKVYLIRSLQLYPLQTGIQTLQPVEIETTVQYQKLEDALQLDPFGSTRLINYPFLVKSEPVSVNVLPFPDDKKPEDFNGVTGDFTIDANTEYKDYAKKEAGVLRVTITGSGNWAMVQQPEIKWPGSVDVFEPKVSENLDSQAIPITGKRIYEFPFSANKAGNIIIAPVTINFFDAAKKKYVTASSKAINVRIRNTLNPLHRSGTVFIKNSPADGTLIFTRIVQVVFPVAAVVLLGWFFLSYRKKRETGRQAELLRRSKERLAMRHPEKPASRYANLLAVNDQPVENKFNSPGNHREEFRANQEIVIEKLNPVNNYQGFAPVTSTEYFKAVKKKVLTLLKTRFNIDEQPLYITKNALEQHGLNSEEINKVAALLALCEKHIYSPFTESFDLQACDTLVDEITTMLGTKGNQGYT